MLCKPRLIINHMISLSPPPAVPSNRKSIKSSRSNSKLLFITISSEPYKWKFRNRGFQNVRIKLQQISARQLLSANSSFRMLFFILILILGFTSDCKGEISLNISGSGSSSDTPVTCLDVGEQLIRSLRMSISETIQCNVTVGNVN